MRNPLGSMVLNVPSRMGLFTPTQMLRKTVSSGLPHVETLPAVSNFSSQFMVMPCRPDITKSPSSSCEVLCEERSRIKEYSKPVSDHLLYLVSFAIETVNNKHVMVARTTANRGLPGIKVAVLNMMMQGRKRAVGYNNAFEIEENSQQYRARVRIIVARLADQIKKHPDIDLILLQEAPIDENMAFIVDCFKRYLPNEFEANISGTPWGIMVVANEKKFPGISENLEVTSNGPMKDRFLTIRLPHLNTELSTLHAPHATPEHAIDEVKINMRKFIRDCLLTEKEAFSHFCIGDFNNCASVIQSAPREVYDDIFSHQMAVRCDVMVGSSMNGHQDSSGKKLTVDHLLGATFRIDDRQSLYQAIDRVKELDENEASLGFRPR